MLLAASAMRPNQVAMSAQRFVASSMYVPSVAEKTKLRKKRIWCVRHALFGRWREGSCDGGSKCGHVGAGSAVSSGPAVLSGGA